MPHDPDPQRLKDLPTLELRRLWAKEAGRTPAPKVRGLLLRELAWRAQQKRHGGLDAQTRALLRAAVRRARGGDPASTPPHRSRPRRAPRARLATGARLVRTWHGTPHEVTVLDGGKRFEYRGEVYRSLSRIARVITGTPWSGPRFFGLPRAQAPR